jgi:lipid II:glycine glycyltransferase (peptidoglycan interpeptide bridge formation enzyme)
MRDPSWDTFVANSPAGQYEQTCAWAHAKSIEGWHPLRISLFSNGKVLGGAQILYKSVSVLGKIAYVSKGPIFAPGSSPEIASSVLRELVRIVRKEHILFLLVHPPNHSHYLEAELLRAGFRVNSARIVQAASTRIDLRADLRDIFANMESSNRKHIRRGEREGVRVREGSRAEISLFFELMSETCKRQRSAPIPATEDFFRLLWDDLESCGGKPKLFFAEYKETVLSSLFLVGFGETVWAYKEGWSGHFPNVRPNQTLHWEAIKWAKDADYVYFDFVGISRTSAENLLSHRQLSKVAKGHDIFKLRFGGQVYLLPRGFAYFYNRALGWVYEGIVCRAVESKQLRFLLNRLMRFI